MWSLIQFKKTRNWHHIQKIKCKLLISWYDFKTPNESQLKSRFNKMKNFQSCKDCNCCKNVSDASRLLSLYSVKSKNKMVAFCMGDQGKFSRILCLHLGSPFTYVLGKAPLQGNLALMK